MRKYLEERIAELKDVKDILECQGSSRAITEIDSNIAELEMVFEHWNQQEQMITDIVAQAQSKVGAVADMKTAAETSYRSWDSILCSHTGAFPEAPYTESDLKHEFMIIYARGWKDCLLHKNLYNGSE